MSFTVSKVIDGDTFEVQGGWKWGEKKGTVVRPLGYNTPEEGEDGYDVTKEYLEELILGEDVELKNPVNVTYGRLLCEVYFDGKNLASYFPEYQS